MLALFDRRSAVYGLALAAAIILALVPPSTAAAATSNFAGVSTPRAGTKLPPAGQLRGQLLTPHQARKSSEKVSPPFRPMNPDALRAAKLKAEGTSQPSSGKAPTAPATPLAGALFNGLNSPGFAASDESNGVTPPDSTGAKGPTRYMEMVNQLVGVYDPSNLTRLSTTDLGTFTAVPSGLQTSDPQIQWDPQGNRWFYAAIAFASAPGNNWILFGWSKTADPSDLAGGWCQYGSSTGSNLQDYPKLGHDANFVTIGTNQYDDSKVKFPFVTANVWAIPKPAATDSTCSGSVSALFFADATHLLRNSDGSLAFTPVPANTADAATTGYIVAAHDDTTSAQNKVMVWHMVATPSANLVADGDISVGSTFSVPPNVPQPGVSYLLDSLDGRLTQAVAHFDPIAGAEAVWTQHTVAGSGRSMVRWYEFLPSTMTIRQQGQLSSATDFYWNAAISPSSSGSDAAIFYNRGSSSLLPVIGAQTRVSSTPLGQMDAGEVLLGSSIAADQETGFTNNCTPNPCRWGDYSGATPDPVNAGVVWGSNQLSGPVFPLFGFAQWTTQNFAVTTVLAPSISANPSTVNPGGTVTASWSGIVSPTAGDWIGLYRAGAADSAYLSYRYTGATAGGSLSFSIPAALSPGMYELRLFLNYSQTHIATSGPITVQVITLSANPSAVNPGGTVTGSWSGIVSPTAGDWIGLYRAGAADSAYLSYRYTGATAGGSLSFSIPASLSAGMYELRLFLNYSQTHIATSSPITVQAITLSANPSTVNPGGTVTASWSGIASPTAGDWIGFYSSGAADSAYLSYRYTGGVGSGSVTFSLSAALSPGTYELRLFPNYSQTHIATSGPITVQ
jgi:hypothetical protein